MLKLLKSELLKGFIFIRLLLIVCWIVLARWFVLMFVIERQFAYAFSREVIGYTIFCILLLLFFTVYGKRYVFGGLRCVPYWGKYFSISELAGLLEGEVFEKVDIPNAPKVKCIKNSENWIVVDNIYFYKPLSYSLKILHFRRGTIWGHYIAIDTGEADYMNFSIPQFANRLEVHIAVNETIHTLIGKTGLEHYAYHSKIVSNAFEKEWGDRPYKELLQTDMRQLKSLCLQDYQRQIEKLRWERFD